MVVYYVQGNSFVFYCMHAKDKVMNCEDCIIMLTAFPVNDFYNIVLGSLL